MPYLIASSMSTGRQKSTTIRRCSCSSRTRIASGSCHDESFDEAHVVVKELGIQLIYLQPPSDVLYVQMLRTSQTHKNKANISILLQPPPHTPYSTWPMGLSSSMPGAIKFVLGSPVALAAEQRAIVGELGIMLIGKFNELRINSTYLREMTSVK